MNDAFFDDNVQRCGRAALYPLPDARPGEDLHFSQSVLFSLNYDLFILRTFQFHGFRLKSCLHVFFPPVQHLDRPSLDAFDARTQPLRRAQRAEGECEGRGGACRTNAERLSSEPLCSFNS